MQQENVLNINIDLLIPNPYQPRKFFDKDSLQELAISIKEYGIINPILVRKKEDKYEIIAGERRYRAAKIVGLTEVPVIVKDLSDEKVIELALIENLQRENLSPIEEAKTYQEILNKSNLTEKKLSEMIGRSQPFISNKLRLLTLPNYIQEALINKKISEKHARSLLTIKDEKRQKELLDATINERLSVKELDNLINEKNITEEEINNAINEIMKSLNIEEEKEEKESDNMNNGNFFPNYVQPQDTKNMSLNTMNMQAMPAASLVPQTQMEQNQVPAFGVNTTQIEPAIPQVEIQNVNNNTAIESQPTPETSPQVDIPSMPTFDFQTPSAIQEPTPVVPTPAPEMSMESPTINNAIGEIPLFGNQNINQTISTPSTEPVSTQQYDFSATPSPIETPSVISPEMPPVATMSTPDTPLFNQEIQPTSIDTNITESLNEVPITVSTNTNEISVDKLTDIENLLTNNGINYKLYSNETGHCIIIEL